MIPWLDLVIAVILICSILLGAFQGLLLTIYHMVRVILVIVLSSVLTPFVVKLIPPAVEMRAVAAYFISFLIISIALGIIAHILDIVNHIPVLKEINRGLGALAGLIRGLLIAWIVLFILVLMEETQIGAEAAKMIAASPFLKELNSYNPIPFLIKQIASTMQF